MGGRQDATHTQALGGYLSPRRTFGRCHCPSAFSSADLTAQHCGGGGSAPPPHTRWPLRLTWRLLPPHLHSNRSTALLKLKKVNKALEDADEVIKLRPDWDKGYFRKAAVCEEQGQLEQVRNGVRGCG